MAAGERDKMRGGENCWPGEEAQKAHAAEKI